MCRWWILLIFLSSCSRWSNAVSESKLNCGADVDPNVRNIPLVDGTGQRVSKGVWSVKSLDSVSGEQPRVTQRGCLVDRGHGAWLVINHATKDSAVVRFPLSGLSALSLTPDANYPKKPRCPSNLELSQGFDLKAFYSSEIRQPEASRLWFQLEKPDGSVTFESPWTYGSEAPLPFALASHVAPGTYELTVKIENAVNNEVLSETCKVELDYAAPSLRPRFLMKVPQSYFAMPYFTADNDKDLLFEGEDRDLKEFQVCWIRRDDWNQGVAKAQGPSACDWIHLPVGSPIAAPAQEGFWEFSYRLLDTNGNISSVQGPFTLFFPDLSLRTQILELVGVVQRKADDLDPKVRSQSSFDALRLKRLWDGLPTALERETLRSVVHLSLLRNLMKDVFPKVTTTAPVPTKRLMGAMDLGEGLRLLHYEASPMVSDVPESLRIVDSDGAVVFDQDVFLLGPGFTSNEQILDTDLILRRTVKGDQFLVSNRQSDNYLVGTRNEQGQWALRQHWLTRPRQILDMHFVGESDDFQYLDNDGSIYLCDILNPLACERIHTVKVGDEDSLKPTFKYNLDLVTKRLAVWNMSKLSVYSFESETKLLASLDFSMPGAWPLGGTLADVKFGGRVDSLELVTSEKGLVRCTVSRGEGYNWLTYSTLFAFPCGMGGINADYLGKSADGSYLLTPGSDQVISFDVSQGIERLTREFLWDLDYRSVLSEVFDPIRETLIRIRFTEKAQDFFVELRMELTQLVKRDGLFSISHRRSLDVFGSATFDLTGPPVLDGAGKAMLLRTSTKLVFSEWNGNFYESKSEVPNSPFEELLGFELSSVFAGQQIVTSYQGGAVVFRDLATLHVIRKIESGGDVVQLSYDPVAHRIFAVGTSQPQKILRFDVGRSESFEELEDQFLSGVKKLSLDEKKRVLYATPENIHERRYLAVDLDNLKAVSSEVGNGQVSPVEIAKSEIRGLRVARGADEGVYLFDPSFPGWPVRVPASRGAPLIVYVAGASLFLSDAIRTRMIDVPTLEEAAAAVCRGIGAAAPLDVCLMD